MRFLLLDSQNLFWRATHVSRGTPEMRGGLALHIMFMSIAQAWRIFGADHVVVALECRTDNNWRKAIDERYKSNRQEGRAALTPKEKEEQEVLFSMLNDYLEFIKNRTNVTVLRCPVAEADDMIARWIQVHPQDEHIIVSSDKDFQQLLSDNVVQYNGITKKIFTTEGSPLHNEIRNGNKLPKDVTEEIIEDPEYLLFEKIIRGDAGDNVFSAYPGVRKKAAKNKPSILTAYNDRISQGFDWNNFMNQKWTDHHGNDQLVKKCFERNKFLIDLSSHPVEVQEAMDQCINDTLETELKNKVGFHLIKFCSKHELNQILDNTSRVDTLAEILGAGYETE